MELYLELTNRHLHKTCDAKTIKKYEMCMTKSVKTIIKFCYYTMNTGYLRLSLHACRYTRSLRLSNTNLLSALFVCTSFGARSFSVAAHKNLELSPYLYQSWHLPSSRQDSLLPAGLPFHLTPLLLCLTFGFCWPLFAFKNFIFIFIIAQFLKRWEAKNHMVITIPYQNHVANWLTTNN